MKAKTEKERKACKEKFNIKLLSSLEELEIEKLMVLLQIFFPHRELHPIHRPHRKKTLFASLFWKNLILKHPGMNV